MGRWTEECQKVDGLEWVGEMRDGGVERPVGSSICGADVWMTKFSFRCVDEPSPLPAHACRHVCLSRLHPTRR